MKFISTVFVCLFISVSFIKAQCPTGEILFELNIIPDNFPQETSWSLTDESGNILHSDNLINFSGALYNYNACVDETSCMTFNIYDEFGDGICCGYGTGSYEVLLGGNGMVTGGEFQNIESSQFNCPPGTTCSNPFPAAEGTNQAAPTGNTWYMFTPTQTGMFGFSTCDNSCGNSTIYIYDYCTGLIWDDTNEGTLAYSESGCGDDLAILNTALAAGQTVFIRIHYDDVGCSLSSLGWDISYQGEVTGCTDPNACNFSPLATQSDGSCIYPGNPDCPDGPDLVILQDVIETSLYVAYLENNDACLIQEGCVAGYGTREVIRFTTHIKNIGESDYFIGAPQANDQWEWDPCHNHWHYEGYAEYVMYDMDDGTELPIGFKNGFCVMDLECSDGGTAQYNCGNQGISNQCGDIYDASLQCQWIDITDLPEGEYILVVKVNWDQSPDALGRVESDFENNWAQVCLDITRDPATNQASFSVIPNCSPYVDCEGTVYGSAQPDCTGTCAGVVLSGDLNADAARTVDDLNMYLQECLLDVMAPTPCNDLNDDGELSVTDAALVFDCILHGTGPVPADHQHTPCDFPYAVSNPNDFVTLRLENLDTDNGYFDVHIKNPNNKMLGFEFDFSGLVIDHVDLLVQNYYPNMQYDDNEIVALAYDEVPIDKHVIFVPLLRVHYSSLIGNEICIANITDFVNDDHEEAMHSVEGGCLNTAFVSTDDLESNPFAAVISPNPMKDSGTLHFHNESSEILTLQILDMAGRILNTINDISGTEIELRTSELTSGIYIFQLQNAEGKRSVGRFVVE